MHASDVKDIKDLPRFFKDISQDIRKKFSDKLIKISTIRSRSIENNTQEISFELKLKLKVNSNYQELHAKIFHKIKDLIFFFKLPLQEDKTFKYAVKLGDKELVISNDLWDKIYNKLQDEKNKPIWDILNEVGKYALSSKKYDAQKFSTLSPSEQSSIIDVFSQGITINLKASIEDINLDNLHQIEAYLEEKLKQAKNNKQSQVALLAADTKNQDKKEQSGTEQTLQENAQNKQVVPFTGSFGCGVTNSGKQIIRAPVVVAAMRDNFSWFRSFAKPFNFLNTVQFFFQEPLKLPTRNPITITYHSEPKNQEHAQDEVDGRKRDGIASVVSHFPGIGPAIGCVASHIIDKIDKSKKKKAEQLCQLDKSGKDQDIGQTTSHTEHFKANGKKSKVKVEQTQEQSEEKQLTIKQAQNDARIALLNNQGRKLDEIFVEIISEYKDQDSETFRNIFNSVFNVVYFQDKQLHEILETDEVSKALEILEIPKPINSSLLGKEYLQKRVYRKKDELLRLVAGIYKQQPPMQPKNALHKSTNSPSSNVEKNQTPQPLPAAKKAKTPPVNTAFKSSLKTVCSSKETYLCLFAIGASISILCLWHLPLGKVPILQRLVPEEKREYIGLILNILLLAAIVVLVLNLAHFVSTMFLKIF